MYVEKGKTCETSKERVSEMTVGMVSVAGDSVILHGSLKGAILPAEHRTPAWRRNRYTAVPQCCSTYINVEILLYA